MTAATRRQWRVAALVLGAVLVLVVLLARRRGNLVEAGLREWLISEVAAASDSVYRLSVGRLRLGLVPGRIQIDTLRLTTDTVRNDLRADPFPVLAVSAAGCRVTGVDTWRLLMARGVEARLVRCDAIHATALEVVREHAPVQPATETRGGAMQFVRDSVALPALVPVILVHRTELPRLSLEYTRRSRSGAETHVSLDRLAIGLTGTRIDPAVPARARRVLFSEEAIITADTLNVLDSDQQSVRLGHMRLSLTDSTLMLDSVVVQPRQTDAEWVKAQEQRKDRIRFRLDSARIRGVDYRRLASLEGAIVARQGTLHGFDLDVLSDKRLPAGPPKTRRSPQQWVRDLDRPLLVDTVVIASGRIQYSEHAADRAAAGVMTWEHLSAEVTSITTLSPADGPTPPMVVDASAFLLGRGKLEARFEIPLTAPEFDMQYTGSLGPMDMTELNRFVAKVFPLRVSQGSLRSVWFSVVVRNGRSTGRVVPVYHDFKIALEDKDGSFLKKAGLSIVSFFANAFKVRGDNPGKTGEKPRAGPVNKPYGSTESLPQVFWFALRGGLAKVFVK